MTLRIKLKHPGVDHKVPMDGYNIARTPKPG